MAFSERPPLYSMLATELMMPEVDDIVEDVTADYDPELLYVECQQCGRPIVWDQGRTTMLLAASGVDLRYLDERCLILSDGCSVCSPDKEGGYMLSVVRVAGLTPEEIEHMSKPAGHA